MATIVKAKSLFAGEALYQRRARAVFPVLVRQAFAHHWITYADLGAEMGIRPRNLNYVLGSVAQALADLETIWDEKIPHLTAVVVNQESKMPGAGLMLALFSEEELQAASPAAKRRMVDVVLSRVYAYPKWPAVLKHFKLAPSVAPKNIGLPQEFGGGESEDHRALKTFVAENPSAVGVPKKCVAVMEAPQPSGDRLDVQFSAGRRIWAVEVKTAAAPVAEITRGFYQVVKYVAVLQAFHRISQSGIQPEAMLALGGPLPEELIPLKNMLGIRVVENVGG